MFNLVRFFTITSLVALILVAVFLTVLFRRTAIDDLTELGERNNVALTQTFANSLWPDFAPFVDDAAGLSAEEIRQHPEISTLRGLVVAQMTDLSVIKVKVYDLNGLTVFSTEAEQIGEDKRSNAGYISARDGAVATELTHRDTFSAFEATIEDRDVISSYVPIYGSSGNIEGVFEVYDDVTPLLNNIEDTQRVVLVGVVGILGILYAILWLIVRYADRAIKQQQQARAEAEKARHASEQRTHTIVQNAPLMLLVADKKGTLTLLEGSALRDLALDPATVIGKPLVQVFKDSPTISRDVPRVLDAESFSSHLVVDDTMFVIHYSPLHEHGDEVSGFIGVATNVTGQIRAEEALGKAINDLEEQNQRLERANEIARSTAEQLETAIHRDAARQEMLTYLKDMQQQFKSLAQLPPKVNKRS